MTRKIGVRWFFPLLGLFWLICADRIFAAGWKNLPGHVPAVTRRLVTTGRLPATNQLHLAIGLPLRDAAGLENFLSQVYDPASPNFRKFLTPTEFTARFGPTEAHYSTVQEFARTNGLKIVATHGNRLLLDVMGSAAAVQTAFHLTLQTYHHPTENRDCYAPDVEPAVDATLPVADVSGLSDFSRPHPKICRIDPANVSAHSTVPKYGSGWNYTYAGTDFRNAYAPGTTLDGTGQEVGLLEFDGFFQSDITNYENQTGLPSVPVQTVLLDGYDGSSGSGNVEVSLDVEMALAMAPGLSQIVVFEGNPNLGYFFPNDVLSAMAASNTVKNLSCSWGWSGGPNTSTENIFKQMAAQGQSFFNASGDSDAFTPGQVDDPTFEGAPSSSPNITQVGGTSLAMNGLGASYASESVWNWGNGTGSSGGISSSNAIPNWQRGINSFYSNGGSPTQRNIPDVALTADYVQVVYANGVTGNVGGTSCAAPLWAGFMALVNQQAAAVGKPAAGFINPAIYEIANESIYNAAFNDITSGDNTSSASPNAFYAVPGYDLCTGLGTPNGTNLINSLVNPDPLIVTPGYGLNAVGSAVGVFNPAAQTFYLTNFSSAPLAWSIINTSAWLNVTASSGTLVAGGSSSVVASLNSAASSLSAGSYTASLSFSNATSGVAHARLFTVQAGNPLEILPTNNFYFAGPVGGPFALAAQGIILTNARVGTVNWTVNNTSTWFNVSPVAGSLLSTTASVVAVTLAPASTNLAKGIYSATMQVTNLTGQLVQTFAGNVIVGQSFIPNGGFETGDFTGWTLSGTGGTANFVAGSSSISGLWPHAGNYFEALHQAGSLAYLSQTLPTVPGLQYLISLWLYSPNVSNRTLTPNEFSVACNGAMLFDQVNLGKIGWTNLQFVVTATGTNTVLQIGGRDDNYYLGLDDVSVIPGLAPTITLQPTNQMVLPGSNAVFNATVNGTTPLMFQWRANGTNIGNGGNLVGATTNVLTVMAATPTNTGNYFLIITNQFGNTTSQVASLVVTLPSPVINGVTANFDGSITLNLAGSPGYTYVLQSTTNFSAAGNWQAVATNKQGANGVWQFTDTAATNFPQQFYRLKFLH